LGGRLDPMLVMPKAILGVAISVVLMLGFRPAAAQEKSLEYAVKATYLYKFAPFVAWPSGPTTGPFDICVMGDDAFAGLVSDAVAGQTFNARPFVVQRVQSAAQASACQILFLAAASPNEAPMLRALSGKPVLTVTDEIGNGPKGIINFVTRDARVRFEINLAEAVRDNLTISSKLLSLAVSVQAAPSGAAP
jgi:hypothetical protein